MYHSSSNIRSARKQRFYGKSLLSKQEKGLPWYAGSVWQARKERIKAIVAAKIEASRARKAAREEAAGRALRAAVMAK